MTSFEPLSLMSRTDHESAIATFSANYSKRQLDEHSLFDLVTTEAIRVGSRVDEE